MAESASASPSVSPSSSPSSSPSNSPSSSPSRSPSNSPSASPSASPSVSPSPIPAGEVSYTMRNRARIGKKMLAFVQITFGSDNDYYPNGGIPLTVGKLGMRSYVDAVIVLESDASGYMFEWDRSANTLRMFVSATGTVNTELNDNAITSKTLELMVIGG
jgi:hypothetical protein